MEVVHNVFQSGEPGIQIRINFTVLHRKDIKCSVSVFFFDEQDNALKDVNNRFRTNSGYVSLGAFYTPSYESAFYSNYVLFMPYSELDLPDGDRRLKLQVGLYDETSRLFVRSSLVPFHYTRKGTAMRGEAIAAAPAAPVPAAAPAVSAGSIRARSSSRSATPAPPQAEPSRPHRISSTAAHRQQSIDKKAAADGKAEELRRQLGWEALTNDQEAFLEAYRASALGIKSRTISNLEKAISLNPDVGNAKKRSSTSTEAMPSATIHC